MSVPRRPRLTACDRERRRLRILAGAQAGIAFLPDGSSSGGRVELADGSRHMQIGVEWLTGRVSVADGP